MKSAQAKRTLPVHARIEENLRSRIREGELSPGDRMPSETELAKAYSTTRTTVRQALSRLVFEGIITRHVGRGSFVAVRDETHDSFPIDSRVCISFEDQVAVTGRKVTYRTPALSIVPAPDDVARQLCIDKGTELFRLERLRVIDGRSVCLETRYIPMKFGRKITGEMLNTQSAHTFLGSILGIRIPTIRVVVSAIVADARLARLLELQEGAALLVRNNVHHDFDGAPLMCGDSIFRGDVLTEYVLGHDPNPPQLPV